MASNIFNVITASLWQILSNSTHIRLIAVSKLYGFVQQSVHVESLLYDLMYNLLYDLLYDGCMIFDPE